MKAAPQNRVYWPTKVWQSRPPEELGLRQDILLGIDGELMSQFKSINGIVVVKNGFIAFERYNNGFGPDDSHNVTSVCKSITSALIGIAIDSGFIKSVDQPVLDFFPEFASAAGDFQIRSLTIRHLLTMTAPFAWKSTIMKEPLDRLRRQKDWVAFILNLLGRNGTPGKFQYNSIGPHLLSAVISRTAGVCAREFANERLFRPLGMGEIPESDMQSFTSDDVFGNKVRGWIHDPQGISTGGWGLTLSPRDMARFGFLFLNHGLWDKQGIISETWIKDSTAPNSNDYGFLWWLKGKGRAFTFAASGFGGNHIFCIPGKDLVVAITSKSAPRPRDRWMLIEKYILPAIMD